VRQVTLDPANFRRQMESSPALIDTGEVLAGGRHRPPRLYRYDTSVGLADNGPLDSPPTGTAQRDGDL
jgi:8-oxo-dGTP diphosphatase